MKMPQLNRSSLFYVSELKRFDKYFSFRAILYLSEHLHQKKSQHTIVIAGATLHLLIHFLLSLHSDFVLLLGIPCFRY